MGNAGIKIVSSNVKSLTNRSRILNATEAVVKDIILDDISNEYDVEESKIEIHDVNSTAKYRSNLLSFEEKMNGGRFVFTTDNIKSIRYRVLFSIPSKFIFSDTFETTISKENIDELYRLKRVEETNDLPMSLTDRTLNILSKNTGLDVNSLTLIDVYNYLTLGKELDSSAVVTVIKYKVSGCDEEKKLELCRSEVSF